MAEDKEKKERDRAECQELARKRLPDWEKPSPPGENALLARIRRIAQTGEGHARR